MHLCKTAKRIKHGCSQFLNCSQVCSGVLHNPLFKVQCSPSTYKPLLVSIKSQAPLTQYMRGQGKRLRGITFQSVQIILANKVLMLPLVFKQTQAVKGSSYCNICLNGVSKKQQLLLTSSLCSPHLFPWPPPLPACPAASGRPSSLRGRSAVRPPLVLLMGRPTAPHPQQLALLSGRYGYRSLGENGEYVKSGGGVQVSK